MRILPSCLNLLTTNSEVSELFCWEHVEGLTAAICGIHLAKEKELSLFHHLTLSGSGFFLVNFGTITKIKCIVSNIY